MRHFLFEEKEYRINPRFRRFRAREQDSAKALARLLRGKKPKHSNRQEFISGGSARRIDARQRCAVKMQYSNNMEAHRKQINDYLIREGKGIDGGKPELYGTDPEEYRAHMADKNFRIFLSPESGRASLNELAKKFIMKLEAATGYKFYWQAANHYNTGHPHTHLLINGRDRNGKEVDIPRDIVKTFMREYAKDICTAQLGARTKEEMAVQKQKELAAPRFTKLDEKIQLLCNGSFRPNLAGIYSPERERIQNRIFNLCKMGLCAYKDGGYKLSPGWEDDLRANGRYNAFLKSRSGLQYSNPASLRIFTGNEKRITGKVTKIYRTDGDASDSHAVIIECLDGKAYFVPLLKKPELLTRIKYKPSEKSLLKEGELVTLETYQTQKGRLTPLIYRQEIPQAQGEIRKNNYQSGLAAEVMNRSRPGANPERRSMQ